MSTVHGTRILVVDDEDDLRLLLQNHISDAGYQVTAARDGEEAILKIQSETFDLALLDI